MYDYSTLTNPVSGFQFQKQYQKGDFGNPMYSKLDFMEFEVNNIQYTYSDNFKFYKI